ncbi:hypothetical protein FF011L_05030 [Roseimaritima multifibrata]|uniref:Mu-like prophage protein Com n=1 Tax=Roseimaritima multifibrata TaxID=1930274 RepID=A0A517MA55_9BACT|nr:hypothetical protein [Roseimaritima multifibrata]QDS91768.1 hypothetical protein FF011L_05030 [Roseimaritima multifibrata]
MQPSQLYFNLVCLVCDRRMRVQIMLLGKEITCGHCTAVTVARDDADRPARGLPHSKTVNQVPLR